MGINIQASINYNNVILLLLLKNIPPPWQSGGLPLADNTALYLYVNMVYYTISFVKKKFVNRYIIPIDSILPMCIAKESCYCCLESILCNSQVWWTLCETLSRSRVYVAQDNGFNVFYQRELFESFRVLLLNLRRVHCYSTVYTVHILIYTTILDIRNFFYL